ncbi:hypothetical protein JCM19233_5739 [Vibrio astriarenae]|nr:hypothetical protein JCM19233_5739 [Vibrio sp. C7]
MTLTKRGDAKVLSYAVTCHISSKLFADGDESSAIFLFFVDS